MVLSRVLFLFFLYVMKMSKTFMYEMYEELKVANEGTQKYFSGTRRCKSRLP